MGTYLLLLMNLPTQLESTAIIAFSDCDPFGHLNNGRYIDYFLNAREEHVEKYYDISLLEWGKRGLGWFVTQNYVAYLRPANYRDKIVLVSRLTNFTESELQIEMLMYDEHKKVLKALYWAKFVHVNIREGKKAMHDASFMELLQNVRYTEQELEIRDFDARVRQLKTWLTNAKA